MQRVLGIDLDAFVYRSEHWRGRDDPRLDAHAHPPWVLPKVLSFLGSNCGLSGPLPGVAVEHHGELFVRWRNAIEGGLLVPPFHVTHVDAHADLGMGDSGYIYLLTELLRQRPDARDNPKLGDDGLGDGNYLAFAIANRWVSQVIYVLGGRYEDCDDDIDYEWQPGDLLPYLFESFDPCTRTVRLPTLEARDLRDNLLSADRLTPLALQPPVPFDWMLWQRFQATEPFDVICLARSPGFTPKAADAIYDEIRSRFVDESGMARSCLHRSFASLLHGRRV